MSPRKVRALVRLDRASERCPALREAFQEARLSWVQANALVGLLSLPETAPFRAGWVTWAERVTVRQLHQDVDAALEAAARGSPPGPPDSLAWQTRAQDTDEEEAPGAADETTHFFFSAPVEVARLLRAVVCSVRRRLECSEGAAWGWMFDHALESWGANDPRVRHERPMLRFELGLRPGQQPLLRYRSGDQLSAPRAPAAPTRRDARAASSGPAPAERAPA